MRATEGLIQDASSLHRLVDSIQRFCEEQIGSHTYRAANKDFLTYAITAAEDTKKALDRAVADGRSFPKRIPIVRSNLRGIKSFWKLLHTYAKPAGDANRLRIPASLLDLATEQLRGAEGMADARVVTMLTPHLMYFQKPHTRFRKSTAQLAAAVSGTALPSKLGFVELPYSLAPNFLSNLIVYHELGHFVYEELEAASPPHSEVAELKRTMIACLARHVDGFGTRSPEYQLRVLKPIQYWTYELFCDLFAIRLIGPAFSFAAVEFFNLLGLMDKNDWVTFSESHPAPCCRFYEHRRQLEEDGWWSHVTALPSEHVATLKKIAAIRRTDYRPGFDGPETDSLITAFLALRPAIRKLVRNVTKRVGASPVQFAAYHQKIEECFLNGVVPSTVVMRGKRRTPPAGAIVNAAVCFYLTSIPRLMRNLQDENAWDVSRRSHWIQRLESWTMKAVEDVHLLDHRAPN